MTTSVIEDYTIMCGKLISNKYNSKNMGITTYQNGPTEIPKRTSMDTETDRNGLHWVPKRTRTDLSSYRNELQWEPEKVGWGSKGTILIKLCMYGKVGRYVGSYVCMRVWMWGGGGVWNSLISKNLAHYSLSFKFLLIL